MKAKGKRNWPSELKAWRKRRGFTQTQAAKFLGVVLRTYQYWEAGTQRFATVEPEKVRDIFEK